MKKLIFIGGVPRSGTTLIQRTLDAHPKITGGPEFDHLVEVVRLFEIINKGTYTGRLQYFFSTNKLKIIFQHLILNLLNSNEYKDSKITCISEKTPRNIFAFKLLQEIFPKAKFICTVRDPRAIVFSMINVRKKMRLSTNRYSRLGSSTIIDCIMVHKYLKMACTIKTNIYFLNYDKLLQSPQKQLEDLFLYLNIEFNDDIMSPTNSNLMSNYEKNATAIEKSFIIELSHLPITANFSNKWVSGLSPLRKAYVTITSYSIYKKVPNYDESRLKPTISDILLFPLAILLLLIELLLIIVIYEAPRYAKNAFNNTIST